MKKWIQTNDLKVTRQGETFDIGDYIDYHDCAGKNGTDLYKGRWQVLGTDDEGRLLILSEDSVFDYSFNTLQTLEGAKNAYTGGANFLNKLCEIYGKGKNVVSVRSIRVEDIDKLTEYDKTSFSNYGKRYHFEEPSNYYCYNLLETKLKNSPKAYDMLFKDERYWLASPFVCVNKNGALFGLRTVDDGYIDGTTFFDTYEFVYEYMSSGVRAVLTLEK